MGQINYNTYIKQGAEREAQSSQGTRVNYFSLKNDKDEAIVRIMHDSTDDFDMLLVHPISIQGKNRNVNCLRSPEEPISNCPFCEAGKPIRSKMYIHMLQYVKNQDGTITAMPVIWDRSASYATEIASKIETYGPLSDVIFKVRRNGAAGSVNTSYSIDYVPSTMCDPQLYRKDVTLMEGIKALGTAVMNKTPEQMKAMLMDSPEQNTNTDTKKIDIKPVSSPQSYTPSSVPEPTPPPVYQSQSYNSFSQQNSGFNSINTSNEIAKPRRYY